MTVLRKSIMAITGLFLCLFLVVHLSANAILLLPETTARQLYNAYSTSLRESTLISIVAYGLYLSIIAHSIYALILTLANKKARPRHYQKNRNLQNSTWTSQNMGLIGLSILLFLVVHLGNFWARIKLGLGRPVGLDEWGNTDVYEVTVELFKNELFVLFYTLLMIPLGMHLLHGFNSAFKSLGLYHKSSLKAISKISYVYAAVIAIGFAIIPLVVYFK